MRSGLCSAAKTDIRFLDFSTATNSASKRLSFFGVRARSFFELFLITCAGFSRNAGISLVRACHSGQKILNRHPVQASFLADELPLELANLRAGQLACLEAFNMMQGHDCATAAPRPVVMPGCIKWPRAHPSLPSIFCFAAVAARYLPLLLLKAEALCRFSGIRSLPGSLQPSKSAPSKIWHSPC